MSDVLSPDVRGTIADDAEALRLMDYPDSTETIPTLDLSGYLTGAAGGLEQAARDLHAISTTVGFFYLKGHGIPQDVIDAVFRESRRFHSLPEAEKDKVAQVEHDGFM